MTHHAEIPLVLAGEVVNNGHDDRYWLGTYYRVSVYNRCLDVDEIAELADMNLPQRSRSKIF